MAYVGWDNREYEDPEMDAMREDAKEAAQAARNLVDLVYTIVTQGNARGVFYTVQRMRLTLLFDHDITLSTTEVRELMRSVDARRQAEKKASQNDGRQEWADAY